MNHPTQKLTASRLSELAAKLRAKKAAELAPPIPETTTTEIAAITPEEIAASNTVTTDKYGNTITYNSQQQEAVNMGAQGKSFVLIGAAGTGKTTTMKGVTSALIANNKAGILDPDNHKYLTKGTPGIVIVAFTKIAVNNIRRNLPEDLQRNCITMHKLLEYEPEYSEVYDPETGNSKTTMSFVPTRTWLRPLPKSITTIIFEESSMIGTPIHQEIMDACPHKPTTIYLGDIQQLAPVFGPAILGFKMLELPVIELTEVYRQALKSPIISLAHRIISGKPLPDSEFPNWNTPGQLTLHPWKKKLHPDTALGTIAQFFKVAYTKGVYDPENDMILIPFNKAFGTIELNKHIANFIARAESRETFEVIAGFNTYYFSIGDKVMFDREAGIITKIESNPSYSGKRTKGSSTTLDYWGYDESAYDPSKAASDTETEAEIDAMLEMLADSTEDKVNQASHTIHITLTDTDREVTLRTAAEVNNLMLGYALTVHKSQGSEWRKVFFILHNSHATMTQRELLYTACTRAREELYVICEPDSFVKGINSQRIKGNTLAEKAEYFKGKEM